MIHLSTSLVSTVIVAGLRTPQRTAALSGGELRWSFFGTALKTIKVCRIKRRRARFIWLLYFRPGLECFCSPRGSSGTRNHRSYWPWKRPQPHVPHSISETIILQHNATQDPSSDILVRTERPNTSLQNLSYKQILLIQYSILKDWPLVNPREERSINKLSQGLLILWFPQTLNCHGERQGRARGWVLTPDLYPS